MVSTRSGREAVSRVAKQQRMAVLPEVALRHRQHLQTHPWLMKSSPMFSIKPVRSARLIWPASQPPHSSSKNRRWSHPMINSITNLPFPSKADNKYCSSNHSSQNRYFRLHSPHLWLKISCHFSHNLRIRPLLLSRSPRWRRCQPSSPSARLQKLQGEHRFNIFYV